MSKAFGVSAVLAALVLAGCGGGGDPVASTAPFPVEAALTRLYESANTTFSANYRDGGDSYVLEENYNTQSNAVFDGQTRQRTRVTATLRRNGQAVSSETTQIYFSTDPLQLQGARSPEGYRTLYTTDGYLPGSALVGTGGALTHSTTYAPDPDGSVLQRATMTWSLEADTQDTALLCLHTRFTPTQTGRPIDSSQCYVIDEDGRTTGTATYAMEINNRTVTFE